MVPGQEHLCTPGVRAYEEKNTQIELHIAMRLIFYKISVRISNKLHGFHQPESA